MISASIIHTRRILYALSHGSVDEVLDAVATDGANRADYTALLRGALHRGAPELIGPMIDAGARLPPGGDQIFAEAAERHGVQVLQPLLERGMPGADLGTSVFIEAVKQGDAAGLQMLADAGCQCADKWGFLCATFNYPNHDRDVLRQLFRLDTNGVGRSAAMERFSHEGCPHLVEALAREHNDYTSEVLAEALVAEHRAERLQRLGDAAACARPDAAGVADATAGSRTAPSEPGLGL